MEGCYYISLGASAFGWTQLVPSLVTLGLSLLTAATNEPVYFLFALYLYVPQYMVWCFQYYFQMVRPDPVCQLYHTWAFPSMEAMYIGALVGFFVAFTVGWRVHQSWFVWTCIYLFGLVPPVILVYTGYNRWWEVAFSMAFGLLASVLFAVILRIYIRPNLPYLMNHFPLSWYTHDTLCMRDPELERQYLEIRDAINK